MPLSMNEHHSCDVQLASGNDNSTYGPFSTIQRALNFLQTKYGADISQGYHGVIRLGPGNYNEAVDLTAYPNIDIIGADTDTTIIENHNGGMTLRIAGAWANNQISNLTIRTSGGDMSQYGIEIQNTWGDVRLVNVKIDCISSCFSVLGTGASLFNCDIISKTTVSNAVINNEIRGLIADSRLLAIVAGAGSVLINNLSGEIRNSTLSTLSTLDDPKPNVKAVNILAGGKLSYCTVQAQGQAVNEINASGQIEYCYLTSVGTDNASVIQILNGAFLRKNYLWVNTGLPAIGSVTGNANHIFDCIAGINGNANIIDQIGADLSLYNCNLISTYNAGGAYHSLGSATIGTRVNLSNVVSNLTPDPRLTIDDRGLESSTLGQAKGWNQRRWWAVNAYNGAITGVGIVPLYAGALADAGDTNGPATQLTASGIGTQASIYYYTLIHREYDPTIYVKFKIGQLDGIRFWCGFFAANPANADNPGLPTAAIRYTSGDPYFHLVAFNAGFTDNTYVPITVAAGTVYTLKIRLCQYPLATPTAIYQLNTLPVEEITGVNIPSQGTPLGFMVGLYQTTAGDKNFSLYDIWCEHNA